MYKFIFFDLDDTLLDFGQAERVGIAETFRQMGLDPTPELLSRYSAINQATWERFERGELTRDEVLTVRFDVLSSELGIPLCSARCEKIYRRLLGIGHYFVPGAPELLEYLYPKYRLFIASNGVAATQDSRLESAGIGHYFEKIFISERIGAHKPDARYFERCFAQIPGFDPAQTILIGDSLTSDILGGKNAGITTCWFNYRQKPPRVDIVPDYTVTTLEALKSFL